ncbi:MAG: tail fiber domain-containing protein [Acidobacteria bacterium]|nr:tail fiber domain-containing protein [Acidobacteriota bacterium]
MVRIQPLVRAIFRTGASLVFLAIAAPAQQRETATPESPTDRTRQQDSASAHAVPRLVKFGGTLREANGSARAGTVGVVFAVYADANGGAPLWMETQNISVDETGKYSALLGASTRGGVPLDLFSSGEPRWLGVQVQLPDEVEQPRVLLVSVPYALKASDADTLGGKPATEYLLRSQLGTTLLATPELAQSAGLTRAPATGGQVVDCTTNCTTNALAKFDSATTVTASLFTDNGTRITANGGIDFNSDFSFSGNANPAASGRVQMFDKAFVGFVIRGLNIVFETLQPAPVEALRIASTGNIGVGTANPGQRLSVAGVVESLAGGFKFPDGSTQITAATGGGSGGVSNIATGTGLTGGPITATGTIAIDTAVVPRLAVSNTFTANQTINGNLTLTGTGTVTGIGGVFDGSGGGVLGRDTTSAVGTGVQGIAAGANAVGVLGSATATTGASNVGVRGIGAGTNAAGVLAEATNTSGNSAGIRAVSSSFAGTAARFDNNAGGNIIEGRWFNGGTGLYELRFRVDSSANVYGANFKDLTTGKNLQLSLFCIAGQIMKYDGTNWNCATDNAGSSGGVTIIRTNTFLGTAAGNATLSGNTNTAYGDSPLTAITTGSDNSAFGRSALNANTTGGENSAFGSEALLNSQAGTKNSAFGRAALKGNTSGTNNVAVGWGAMLNTNGSNNVVVGSNALAGGSNSGDNNIAIGANAGFSNIGNDNIYIGTGTSSGGTGTIHIGSTAHLSTFIAGIYLQPSASGVPVLVNSGNKLGISTSSRRFKEDIATIDEAGRKLMQLRPVQFRYKAAYDDGSHILQYGLIAEEVEKVMPELVVLGADGKPATVRYNFLPPLLLSEVQRLESEVTDLRQALAAQSAEMAELKAAVKTSLALSQAALRKEKVAVATTQGPTN